MLTKGIITSINSTGTRCTVRMPLFESASNPSPVEAEAIINIPPGIFNGFVVNDVVLVGFEENELHRPIVLGKLFKGNTEGAIRGGGGIFDTVKVNSSATLPSSTLFAFPTANRGAYSHFTSPKDVADYIKWLELITKNNIKILQNRLRPENVVIDDGDIDYPNNLTTETESNITELTIDKNYPNI